MEILEEQNPLQIAITSASRKPAYTKNSAGRPKQEDVIKFGPEPKSVVSQLLKEKTTQRSKQKTEIKKDNESVREYVPEFTEDGPTSPKKQSKIQETKSYMCEYKSCTYKTTSSSNMIKHRRRHTSEKPYMCDQCSFRTNFINSLTVHKRIHSGERPFVCEHCSYCCNSSSNLKKHCMHKHTGIT